VIKRTKKDIAPLRRPAIPRYQSIFLGVCYSCNNFGHKAMNCRVYGKGEHMRRRNIQNVECYTCHTYGHIARNCISLPGQGHANIWKEKTKDEDLVQLNKVRYYNQRPNMVWRRKEKKQDREGPNGFVHSTEEEGFSLACLF
jgi:hypothetical protein